MFVLSPKSLRSSNAGGGSIHYQKNSIVSDYRNLWQYGKTLASDETYTLADTYDAIQGKRSRTKLLLTTVVMTTMMTTTTATTTMIALPTAMTPVTSAVQTVTKAMMTMILPISNPLR